jgi:hypothetical protein
MKKYERVFLFLLVLFASLGTAAADPGGAGGLLFGLQRPDWNPPFMPEAATPMNLEFLGGYGYGVDREGVIVGGFGMAMLDAGILEGSGSSADRAAGGIGGMIIGQRIVDERRLHLDLAARLGLGGTGLRTNGRWKGYALAYAEPYLELGLGLTPWMRVTASVGYQVLGNFAPGRLFKDFFMRTPTMGFSIAWGRF